MEKSKLKLTLAETFKIIVNAHGASESYFKEIADKAINFAAKCIPIEFIKITIIFTSDYNLTITEFVGKKETNVENGREANGRFITNDCLKEKEGGDGNDIIVINCDKIFSFSCNENEKKNFMVSVVVHELVHWFDYLRKNEFYLKYEIPFRKKLSGRDQKLECYFYYRSEMRAKYYQEKYYLGTVGKTGESIEKEIGEIPERIKVQTIEEQWYNVSHAWGQVLCWKKYDDRFMVTGKKYLNSTSNKENKVLPLIFELNRFYKFCDRLTQCVTEFKHQ